MNPEQVSCYNISFGINKLGRALSNPSNVDMTAAKHLLLRYMAGPVCFFITYKLRESKLTAYLTAT